MNRPQTLVVALDFSPGAEAALIRAADLAERTGAALHLLHADVLSRTADDGDAPDATPSSALRLRVERFAAETLGLTPDGLDGLAPTVAVVRGHTAPEVILRYATTVGADLLVTGTHGRSGVDRLLMGSVAEACVAGASCPVLTVPYSCTAPAADAPVLVAIDFSACSRAALAAGQTLADLYGATVEVVHVVRDAGPYPGFAPALFSVVDVDPAEGDAVRARLAHVAEAVGGPPPAAVHVGLGTPARVVPALAGALGARAVVLGTHGRAGSLHALVGSVAEATLRRAPCPVLTLQAATPQPHARRPVRSALPA